MELRFKLLVNAPGGHFPLSAPALQWQAQPGAGESQPGTFGWAEGLLSHRPGCWSREPCAPRLPTVHLSLSCPPGKWEQPPSCPMDTKPWLQENPHTEVPRSEGSQTGRSTSPGDHPVPTPIWMLNSGEFAVGLGLTVPTPDHGVGAGGSPRESHWNPGGGAGPGSPACTRYAVGPWARPRVLGNPQTQT